MMWARRSLPQPWPPTIARLAGSSAVREPTGECRLALVLLLEIEIGGHESTRDRLSGLRLRVDLLLVEHPRRLERFEEQLVLALRIFLDPIEVEELLPRIGELLVGGDHRHQRA